MRFDNAAQALHHLHSEEGGPLWHLKHTQVTHAAKANITLCIHIHGANVFSGGYTRAQH